MPARLPSNTMKGALLLIAAWQIIPFMDAIAKHLSAVYPIVQLVWARFFFHFIIVVPVLLWRHGPRSLLAERPILQIGRGFFLLMATFTFFWSIKYIPLATAVSLIFIEPIILTVLAARFLGEQVSISRWLAVLTGFLAVLIIIRPGFEGFHWASLLAIGAAISFACFLLSTRMLAGTTPPLVTLVYQSICGLVVTSAILPFVWVTPDLTTLALMITLGAVAALSHFLLITAFEHAEASHLAPLSYTEIIMATILGYWWFGDLPDLWSWVGMAMIIATALYVSMPQRQSAG